MNWICNARYTGTARLDNKTIIVTGCNTGIGKEAATEFYKRGGRVIMACRDVGKAEHAATDIKSQTEGLENKGELVIKQLDLGSFASIRKCAQDLIENEDQINILVNNAGLMACPRQLTEDGFEMQFAVNHLGHFLFTLLLLPKIIRSAPARIVTVASYAHKIVGTKLNYDDINLERRYNGMEAYQRSKLANVLFSYELGRRLKGTGVTTYSLHPGLINTEITRHYEAAYPWGLWLYHKIAPLFIKTSTQGAQTIIYCALDEKCASETGLYYSECRIATPSRAARDGAKAEELWEKSRQYVQLDEDYDPFVSPPSDQ